MSPTTQLDTVLSNASENYILNWKRKCFTKIRAQDNSTNLSLSSQNLKKKEQTKNPTREGSCVSHQYP